MLSRITRGSCAKLKKLEWCDAEGHHCLADQINTADDLGVQFFVLLWGEVECREAAVVFGFWQVRPGVVIERRVAVFVSSNSESRVQGWPKAATVVAYSEMPPQDSELL